ncbi:ARM repeat superfamily protein [Rhynchospora pubera]|uniref:ARM repeat superfamily protein n=1 Tax=Rhynchospora pubera TaxID=906938 RepID=A0AAV8F028_9POAL|nr:ARM repeat superfamily protein [Rhynchospora pubera]
MSEISETRDRDEHSVLDIIQGTPRGSSTQGSPNLTMWEPGLIESDESSVHGPFHTNNPNAEAPEKELTLFALRLAILEQLASGLGTLAFIWATVVLLGGFAIALSRRDFWFVTIILVIEGARIYSRSGELEWQHQSTWTFTGGARGSFQALKSSSRYVLRRVKAFFNPVSVIQADRAIEGQEQPQGPGRFGSSRTWNFREVPLLSFWGRVFLLKNIGEALIWLQVSFAIGSMTLSLVQLATQHFGELKDSEMTNRNTALNLFYGLAVADDALFLMEKLYWSWKIHQDKLLESVSRKCGFSQSSRAATDLIKRFFYDVYSTCITDSIFGGLKKDLVSYAEKLLDSGEPDKHLMGAKILMRFVTHDQFASDTMRKIGTSGKTMERLVEMLSWKNGTDVEIRMLAAQILSRISGKRKGSICIARIPGSLEAIASLLHNGNHEVQDNQSRYDYSAFNLLGLLILRNLASDHENCEKMGKSPGLISKIIDFTAASSDLLLDEHPLDSQIKLVRRALQVVLLLANTKGDTGNVLRQLISKNVFIVGHIREILKHGKKHMVLQKISIQILTCLAMDEDATDRIASTGGVVNLLLKIFFEPGISEETSVSDEAGEALSMLTLKSPKTCNMILQESNVLRQLVDMLQEKLQCPYASRILRNTCVYATPQSASYLNVVIEAFPTVLKRMIKENEKLLEVSIGLLIEVCKLMGPAKFNEELVKAEIALPMFVERLVSILKEYKIPDIKVPRLRRFVIELSIWMMSYGHLELFKNTDMETMLQSVAETTTELENFHLFSGSVGLCQHSSAVAARVEEALELLHQGSSMRQ